MLDLEYLASSADAVVVQIGAMPFDLATGEYDPGLFFSANLSVREQLDQGRKVDARTLEWWMGQAAEKGLPPWWKEPQGCKSALESLTRFLRAHTDPNEVRVWNHVGCDSIKIQDLCTQFGVRFPWPWRNTQHITTLVYLSGVKPPKHTSADHEAVSDCVRQILYCHKCWKALHPEIT